MGRNYFRNFSTFVFALLAIVAIPSLVLAASCGASVSAAVTASVTTDTLSAVSGTDLPLQVSLTNDSNQDFTDGSLVVTILREPTAGDFSQGNEFVVTRAIVKTGIDLAAHSTATSSFLWSVPAALPTGVYRADAAFSQGGQVFANAEISTRSPFGNSAKVFISGAATGTVFFIAGNNGNDKLSIVIVNTTGQNLTLPLALTTYSGDLAGSLIASESRTVYAPSGVPTVVAYSAPTTTSVFSVSAQTLYRDVPAFYVYSSGNSGTCFDPSMLYEWAMFVGGLGVVVFVLVLHFKKKSDSFTR